MRKTITAFLWPIAMLIVGLASGVIWLMEKVMKVKVKK